MSGQFIRVSARLKTAGAIVALALIGSSVPGAVAQQRPIPPEPVYRDRTQPPPQGYQQPQDPRYQQPPQDPRYQQPPGRPMTAQQQRCAQLEHELATNWMRNQQNQNNPQQLEEEIRKYDQIYQTNQAQAERTGCYESVFIFGRALVRTPRCLALNEKIEDARRQLARLEEQRNASTRGGQRMRQDTLIEELARNGCGEQYEREARRNTGGGGFFGWFGGNDQQYERPRRDLPTSQIVPYATYRTLCVRACDGYYFPVSFSTLPSHFSQDASQCQSQCAAPAELYVYRNPGEEPEQMISLQGRAYSELTNAFRYRKEYVKGCSCNQAEYDPVAAATPIKKSEVPPPRTTTPQPTQQRQR